jgi:hypothetical protein
MPLEALASSNPGAFLVLALALPVAGILLVLLAGGRYARGISLALLTAGVALRQPSPAAFGGRATR